MTAVTLPDLSEFPGVTLAEADGVPVLLAPREGNTGGGIIFRVGSAHETLAISGITHLIEHLALRDQVLSEAHLNGQTHADVTLFHVGGSATDVVAYLNDVCSALRDLPVDLIETEKDILRSEAAGKHRGFGARLRISRHGARGFGLAGYGERGLDRITTDEVLDWASTWFTRENAVAWITADALPEGLDLRLPAGERMPPPVLTDVLGTGPAYLTGLEDGVALDTVVPRGTAAGLTSRVLREVLHRDLRGTADIASTIDVDHDFLDAEHTRLSVAVQGTEGQQGAAAGGLADALSGLRFHVTDDDLAAARAGAVEELIEAAAAPAADHLPGLAHRLLTGRPLDGPQRMREQVESVTADEVLTVAREAWANALWFGPVDMDWAGVDPAAGWSERRAEGRSFQRIDVPDLSLVLAPDGVGTVSPQGAVTVRFEDCVLLESVPDGARALTGADGFRILIEPTMYGGLDPAAVAAHVDPRVPPDVVVHLPAREPDDIPVARPPVKEAAPRVKADAGPRSVLATVGFVLGLWAAGVVVLGGGQVLLQEAFDINIRLGFLPLLALGWATYGLVKKRHPKEGR
jgi:predicted Zn-dependent peptidase